LLDEARIQLLIYGDLVKKGHYAVIPNISWAWLEWEADLLSITKSGYIHEYEIKVTQSDFKHDFRKKKHWHFRSSLKVKSVHKSTRMPNCFWYVAPLKAIPLCIPDYAGLILVQGNRYGLKSEIIKKPTILHRNKLSEKGRKAMLRSLMFKYWNIAREKDRWKIQKELFNKEWGEGYD